MPSSTKTDDDFDDGIVWYEDPATGKKAALPRWTQTALPRPDSQRGELFEQKNGDLAKIDLAVHIDGFVSSVAHTILIGEAVAADDKRACKSCLLFSSYYRNYTFNSGEENRPIFVVILLKANFEN